MTRISEGTRGPSHLVILGRFAAALAKVHLQYRSNTLALGLAVFSREAANVAAVYFMLARFGRLDDWSLQELLFLYSFLFVSYSIVTLLFAGVRDFESLVYEGEFDRFLCRPLSPLFQVVLSKADYAATLGHGAIGIGLFLWCARQLHIDWTFWKIAFCVLAVAGGVLIQLSIFLISASLAFFTVKSTNVRNMVFFNVRRIAAFPVTLFSPTVRILIVYVVPFAFVDFFPAQFFLRKPDVEMFPGSFMYLTPLVGAACVFVAWQMWRLGIRHYSSVGS